MQRKRTMVMFLIATILVGSGFALAAEEGSSPPQSGDESGQHRMPMQDPMMGGGMMGGGGMMDMMGMMERCNRMMSSGTMGGGMAPQLPAGNEKLQLQMQAEIMQRVGEIVAKYAGKVKDGQGGAR